MWYNEAGCPRSSPSPLRGNCRLRRRCAIWRISAFSHTIGDEGKPRPYNTKRF
ncbi:MAG: hypothetical protein LBQ66_15310 [Planctomycetaceae bacterium]|nr:hypothetical protein [Planctomycetaceae bacterium]